MYSVVENVLKNGGYNLNDIIRKIDVLWVKGSLTDEEKNGLLDIARGGAKTENSFDILAKLNDLENRIRSLESGNVPEDDEEYPEYKEGKWYYNGDKCSSDGEHYVCTAPDGVVCVWSPSVYPAYWKKV